MEGVVKSFDIISEVPTAKWKVVAEHEDLVAFQFPYYLKADVAGHKTDLGGVVRCDDLDDAESKLKWIHSKFPENKIIIQESFEGIEMIVGIKTDKVFGKLLLVGFGGIFAEVKKDVAFRALPVTKHDIKEMILELEGKDVFKARGKNYDLTKFISLIEKVVQVVEKKKIKELDLNPVIVGEKKSLVVDSRIDLE